nr:tryptophan--tRNA ligase, chloroplastic/mitochondrial-like [Nicotiana tomentosiformis]
MWKHWTWNKKRIVSSVKPTRLIHVENYLGAMKNWIHLQDTYETFFSIVDLHTLRDLLKSGVECPAFFQKLEKAQTQFSQTWFIRF